MSMDFKPKLGTWRDTMCLPGVVEHCMLTSSPSVLAAGPDVTLVRPERDLQLFEKDSQTSADSKFKTLPLKEHAATHGRACDLLLTPS